MRMRPIGSVPLAVAFAFAFAFASVLAWPLRATVDEVKSCTIWGGNALVVGRGGLTDVTVTGFGVDLATSVTTTLPGTTLTVVSRKNGFGSNIVLRFSPPAVGDAASGSVTLHYFGGGSDVFSASLSPGPAVTSIAFASGGGVSTSGGSPRVTSLDPHVLVLKGTNLNAVYLNDSAIAVVGLRDARIVLQLPGELRISFTSDAGDRTFDEGLLVVNAACASRMSPFALGFTVFDVPRTPTPTATPSPTRTPTPLPFSPIRVTPGIRTSLPSATPTPQPTRPSLLPPRIGS